MKFKLIDTMESNGFNISIFSVLGVDSKGEIKPYYRVDFITKGLSVSKYFKNVDGMRDKILKFSENLVEVLKIQDWSTRDFRVGSAKKFSMID